MLISSCCHVLGPTGLWLLITIFHLLRKLNDIISHGNSYFPQRSRNFGDHMTIIEVFSFSYLLLGTRKYSVIYVEILQR